VHASPPFYDAAKVTENLAVINGFLKARMLFIAPFQHVSSRQD
jgi:hypothetical protein